MYKKFFVLVKNNLRAILRDRVLYAVGGVAVAMIMLVPVMSSFSMRQVQELAISLSLSTTSMIMLVVTLLLGSSSIWRDIERRYTSSVLTLPIARGIFLVSKFVSISVFLFCCAVVLGMGCALVIYMASATYPSQLPIAWGNITLVLAGNVVKYMLLASFALFLSSVSTSFYLPFFGTFVIYFCGSSSQEVYEYVTGQFGHEVGPLATKVITGVYYCLPNLSAFDYQVHAVYSLDVPLETLFISTLYAIIYMGIMLGLANFAFCRRELL